MAIAGSNTFPPRIDPPKARNVREFYTEFWSTPRPEGTLPSAEQLPTSYTSRAAGSSLQSESMK
jgi:hypothetical protein